MTAILALHCHILKLLGNWEPEICGTLTVGRINSRLMKFGQELKVEWMVINPDKSSNLRLRHRHYQ